MLREAVAFFRDDATRDALASANVARLDQIYSDSVKDNDRKTAIKALETQGKFIGAFEERVKLDSDSEVNFIFNVGDVGEETKEDDGSTDKD